MRNKSGITFVRRIVEHCNEKETDKSWWRGRVNKRVGNKILGEREKVKTVKKIGNKNRVKEITIFL